MQTRIKNEVVEVPLNGVMIQGLLSGDESRWTFQSVAKDFLALFGEGIVCSYTYLGSDRQYYEQHRFQLEVAATISEILEERRATMKAYNRARGNSNMPRRFVMP